MLRKIRTYIEAQGLLKKGDRVLVGLSGGADSVCLLTVLTELGYDTTCVHCNFHLRGEESQRDEDFVRELCERKGVRLVVKDFDTEAYAREHGVSIEMAARELRYDYFHELMEAEGFDWICVGHHSDDNVETMLINLLRGTGLRGLCGIQPKNGPVVRPLLCCGKEEILSYLIEKGETYVTDSSNLENDVVRNRIRLDVIPLLEQINPSARHNLLTTLENLNEAQKVYKQGLQGIFDTFSETYATYDLLHVKKKPILDSVSPLTVLHEFFSSYGFSRSQLVQLLDSIDHTGKIFVADDKRLLVDRTELILENKPLEPFEDIEIDLLSHPSGTVEWADFFGFNYYVKCPDFRGMKTDSRHAYLDLDKTDGKLTVRRVRPGDSFIPFGMKGRKLVSDYMTDRKFNLFRKERQVVAESGGRIAWLVGERASEEFRVEAGCTKWVEMES